MARALAAAGRVDVLARLFATAIYAAQCSKAVADADSTILRAFAEAERNAALANRAGGATGLSAKTMLRSASLEQRRTALKEAVPNARMCSKCGFGPLININCDTATHAHEASNACVRCGFFGSNWNEFPYWDGRLPEEHDAAGGGDATQGRGTGKDSAKMESTVTTASSVDLSPMCSWTTASPILDDATTYPSGTLFVPTLGPDPSADRSSPYDCQIQVEGGDPRYWLNQFVQQHLYDRWSNPLCTTGADAGTTLITETGLRYCTKGHDTINGLSLEDHARSFVRCQVLAVPDLLGVEDEVWLYVEQDLNAHVWDSKRLQIVAVAQDGYAQG